MHRILLQLLEHYQFGFWSQDLFNDLDQIEKDKLKALGFYTDKDYPLFANCIVFPLYIMNREKIHTFYGRKTADRNGSNHYLLTNRRGGLYLPKAGLNPRWPVVITESILDGLSLFTAKITNVLPLNGTNSFHEHHLNYLKEKQFPKVFIAFNGDTAGKRGSAALAEKLKAEGLIVAVLELPEGKDINEMLTEQGPEYVFEWFKGHVNPQEHEDNS